MEIDEMLNKVNAIASESHPILAGTSMTYALKMKMQEFCKSKRLTLRQGLDLAVYWMLIENEIKVNSLSQQKTEPIAEKETMKTWIICQKCTRTNPGDSKTCSNCGTIFV